MVSRMTLAALALLAVRHRRLRFVASRVLGTMAVVAVVAFFNFGPPFHSHHPGFADLWEQFHYQLGSKYFAELGKKIDDWRFRLHAAYRRAGRERVRRLLDSTAATPSSRGLGEFEFRAEADQIYDGTAAWRR